MNIVDRRPNPKGKSLPNRQRFLERAKHEIVAHFTDRPSSIADLPPPIPWSC